MAITSKFQKLNKKEMEGMQLEELRKQLKYVYRNSKFYKRKFSEAGIKPTDIKSFNDFRKIPLTTKEELRKHNWDFVCKPMKDIVDIGATTGTSGRPVLLPVTSNDWNSLLLAHTSAFECVGITKKDVLTGCRWLLVGTKHTPTIQ